MDPPLLEYTVEEPIDFREGKFLPTMHAVLSFVRVQYWKVCHTWPNCAHVSGFVKYEFHRNVMNQNFQIRLVNKLRY